MHQEPESPPAMDGAAPRSERQDPLALLQGLLDPVQSLIGKQAGTSLFHFAAVQEGRRISRSHARDGLPRVLAHLDAMLDQKTEIREETNGRVLLVVRRALPLDAATPAGGIVVGLLEGAVAELRGEPYVGTVQTGSSNGSLNLLLSPSREVDKPDGPR